MMGLLTHSTGLVLVWALLGAPVRTNDVVCASQSAGYLYCRAETARGVTLIEQLGPFACNKGNTWDYDKGGIWVANGCAARFRLGPDAKADALDEKAQGSAAEGLARDMTSGARSARKRPAPPSPATGLNFLAAPPSASQQRTASAPLGQPSILVCESKQYKVQKCPVPVRAHVQLSRKLGRADCRFNSSWGYDYGEIWVRDGCRAEFLVY